MFVSSAAVILTVWSCYIFAGCQKLESNKFSSTQLVRCENYNSQKFLLQVQLLNYAVETASSIII